MIEGYLQYIAKEKRYSAHTITAYKQDLESFAAYINERYECTDFTKVKQQMVRSWLAELAAEQYSAKSLHRKKTSLSGFFRFLIYKGITDHNPARNVPVPKIKERLPIFIDEQALQKDNNPEISDMEFPELRDLMIFELLYATGMRRSELINLTDRNIDYSRKTIKVLGKRNKERLIPFGNKLLTLLKLYCEMRDSFFEDFPKDANLLLTNAGKKMYPNFVYRKINTMLDNLSTIKKKSPHVMRHTFATHMLNNGADLSAIKELLGHANLSATQIYTHTNIKKLQEVYSKAHPKS
ncbi:MAG: integrase [Marinilabiliales bacterium]|nr:MAG: integrase [Marinilabiliales bacterium]